MLHSECEKLDPRIRRTRHLLQDALRKLLAEKDFDKISVQDITGAATLNRATFYAHYPDKFALLEESIRVTFLQHLDQRHVRFDGTCPSAFKVVILAVCDFLIEAGRSLSANRHQFEPFLQATVIDQIRIVLLEGLRRHDAESAVARRIAPETIAATASWAIYGAARQWVHSATESRMEQQQFVDLAAELVQPILMAGVEHAPDPAAIDLMSAPPDSAEQEALDSTANHPSLGLQA